MDINENILQAIQIVAESEVNKVSFDKTVICDIVDDTEREKGHYIVAEEGAEFDAYCESKDYRKGQQVYVLIPGGKYDALQKTIISKYNSKAAEQPITYVKPFEQLVLMDNQSVIPTKGTFGIRANGKAMNSNEELVDYKEKLCYDFDVTNYNSKTCTTFGLKCDFKCLLQNYYIESGEYGLKFEFFKEVAKDITKDSKPIVMRYSSKNVFGNPYAFVSYVSQEGKLNIQSIDFTIKHIKIYLYQDANFKVFGEDKLLDYNKYTDDIYVRNIELYFANDISLIENETFQIYCDDLTYGINDNSREIYVKWYNKDPDNRYIGFNDETEEIKYSIQYFYFYNGGWKPYDKIASLEQKKQIALNKNLKKDYYKAILFKGTVPYQSNVLTFENINITEDPLAADRVAALNILLGENAKSAYPMYGADNTLINPAEAHIERELNLSINKLRLDISDQDFFENAIYYWYIPKGMTMLSYDEQYLKDKNFILNKDYPRDNMVCFKYTGEKKTPPASFYFQIQNNYNRNAILNVIECTAIYNGISYTTSIHFTFSSFGTNGTDYTLVINPLNKRPSYENPFVLEAILYDPEYKEVTLSESGHEFKWSCLGDETFNQNGSKINISNYGEKYNIYQVDVKFAPDAGKYINLSCKYSLPWGKYSNYCAIIPTEIIYNSLGTNPSYYKGQFKIYDINTNQEVKDLIWKIKKYNYDSGEEKYLPQIRNGALSAPTMFVSNLQTKIAIQAYSGNDLIWEQPIMIFQNAYSSKVLNQWDGSLQIDEDKNNILTAMVGAGKKNQDNTFDGVLMGDVSNAESDNNGIGLYGYDHGEQTFGFRINGTAFIGKSGIGRIDFSGNKGIIKSGNYDPNGSGMLIDLPEGHIDAFNFKLSAKNLLLQSAPAVSENDFFLCLKDKEDPFRGEISYAGDGTVKIIAETLEVHTPFGGDNLIKNSAPIPQEIVENSSSDNKRKPDEIISRNEYNLDSWVDNIDKISIVNENDKKSIFKIPQGNMIGQWIPQIEKNKFYVFSSWVKGDFTFYTAARNKTQHSYRDWHFIKIIFTGVSNDFIEFYAEQGDAYVWHPKVEQGRSVTSWGRNANDLIDTNEYQNNVLTQEKVWKKLSNNGNLQGFWIHNKELYVNATYIVTGILRSINQNSIFNLNTGDFSSKQFMLNAGDKNTKNYIGLFSKDSKDDESITIKNNQDKDWRKAKDWRIVAGNKFGVTSAGSLYAADANISGDIIGSTITGSNFIGGSIYVPERDDPAFKVTSDGAVTASNITITGGSISITNNETISFYVNTNGALTANSATITGTINANSGYIGNWIISNNWLEAQNPNSSDQWTLLCPPGTLENDYVFLAGGSYSDDNSHPFRVKSDGTLYATKAYITGEITATSGKIGGWNIEDKILSAEERAVFEGSNCWVDNKGQLYYEKKYYGSYYSLANLKTGEDLTLWLAEAERIVFTPPGTNELYYQDGDSFISFETKEIVPQYWKTFIAPPGVSGAMASHVFAAGNNMPNYCPFQVLKDGSVIATQGRIGGWAISNSKLYAEGEEGSIYLSAPNKNTSNPIINIGTKEGASSYFAVDGKGNMTARNAVITGEVTATKFTMGTKEFTAQQIYVPIAQTTAGSFVSAVGLKFNTSATYIGLTAGEQNVPVTGTVTKNTNGTFSFSGSVNIPPLKEYAGTGLICTDIVPTYTDITFSSRVFNTIGYYEKTGE